MPTATLELPHRTVRTLFLSDLHMGARGCRAADILAFLRSVEAETIYLVGDILDLWHPGKRHWGPLQEAIWTDLRQRATNGIRIVYLPGNHDDALRHGNTAQIDQFELIDSLTHVAADGTRYLVLHGDQVDSRIFRFHVMTRIGSRLDAALRALDQGLRRLWPRAERGVFEWIIHGVNALMVLGNGFEKRLAAMALGSGHEGVICGHFHKAALKQTRGITYANCGDWVDSRTALIETFEGALQLVGWCEAAQTAPQAHPQFAGVDI